MAVSSGGVGGTASNAGNAKVGDGADGRGFSGGGGFGAIASNASNSSVTGGRGGFIYYAPVVTLPNSTFAGVNDGSSAAGYFLCMPTSSATALNPHCLLPWQKFTNCMGFRNFEFPFVYYKFYFCKCHVYYNKGLSVIAVLPFYYCNSLWHTLSSSCSKAKAKDLSCATPLDTSNKISKKQITNYQYKNNSKTRLNHFL